MDSVWRGDYFPPRCLCAGFGVPVSPFVLAVNRWMAPFACSAQRPRSEAEGVAVRSPFSS
jgi:hypothetical protein